VQTAPKKVQVTRIYNIPHGRFGRFKLMSMSEDLKRVISKRIDDLEISMIEGGDLIDIPVKHLFCHGMYVREVTCPTGSLVTTKIHKTEHPFTVSKGRIRVMLEDGTWSEVSAPYTGITKKGTRRVCYILEECVWTTYHPYRGMKYEYNFLPPDQLEAIIDRIERRVVEKHHIELKDIRRKELCHS